MQSDEKEKQRQKNGMKLRRKTEEYERENRDFWGHIDSRDG